MSTYKTKYFKNTKKINNTIWLDKLINQLEKKSKGVWSWIHLEKNELDPKFAFYDCHRSLELKSASENSLEECIDHCEPRSLPKNLDG